MAVIDLSRKGLISLGQRCFPLDGCEVADSIDIDKLDVSESIQNLDVSQNKLTNLPNDLLKMRNLKEVNLSENCFKSIPQVLQSLPSIVSMNLAHNSISITDHKILNLEEEFEFLKPKLENNLELVNQQESIYSKEDLMDSSSKSNSVDSGIILTDYSFEFCSLVNLSHIDLSHNQIQFFPESLTELGNLHTLNISHNLLSSLPATLKCVQNLRCLDLSWNRLLELPLWVGMLTRCIKFSVSGNPIGDGMEFPDDFGTACKRIKYLEMENTHIRDFPSTLTSLLDLRHLLLSNKNTTLADSVPAVRCGYFESEVSWKYSPLGEREAKDRLLHRNSLWTFPSSFSQLLGLVKLEAVDVGLADLPEALGKLRNLKILDVSKNNLSWIPKSFIELSNLEFCNFSQNSILMLPLDIETMPRLTHLLAGVNMIAELPEKLCSLSSLETLDVYENQIFSVPSGLVGMGLRRLDLAQNYITESQFRSQTSPADFQKYLILQARLRSWDGVLAENQRESYKLDTSLFQERKEFRTVEGDKTDQHQPNINDLLNSTDDEEEVVDFHGNTDADYLKQDDEQEVEESPPLADAEEEEDWTSQMAEPYSPPKVSYSHNLRRMDQESWWGQDQFCPADQHATPRNEKMLKNWERDRQMRMLRHVGRGGRSERQPSTLPLLREGQFDDME